MTRRPIALLLGLLLAASGLSAQARHARGGARSARARACAAETQKLLQTAQADLRADAFESAARAYAAVLQLKPDDPAAREGLALARAGACQEDAGRAATAGQWTAAAMLLRRCRAGQPENAAATRALAAMQRLGDIEAALARSDWPAADLEMKQLATGGLPFALDGSLAAAYARFGAGDAPGAERLAATLSSRRDSGGDTRATAQFAAFLRDRARRRAGRAGALPLLAAYLAVLACSLYWGLRGAYGAQPGRAA